MSETLANVAVAAAILVSAFVVTQLFVRAMYRRCSSCGALNAKRRRQCRECGDPLPGA